MCNNIKINDIKIFLASGSPRRKELLKQMGINFEVKISNINENLEEDISPDKYVQILSARKASAVFEELSDKINDNFLVIGSDTVVSFDNKILGKPIDENDAFNMLKKLQGNKHTVYTGITVVLYNNGKMSASTISDASDVYIRNLNDDEILDYIKTGEPLDKAGAYGIQEKGAIIINKIDGDYYTVVGLSISKLYTMLKSMGIDINLN